MKNTLVFLLLSLGIVSQSHAGIAASMPNQIGGRIDLYDVPTPKDGIAGCAGSYIAKTWGNGVADQFGCWTLNEDLVVIHWDNGEYRSYPANGFSAKTRSTKQGNNTKGSM
jgi:hypothetical protein